MLNMGEAGEYIHSQREVWEGFMAAVANKIGVEPPNLIAGWLQINKHGNTYRGMYNALNNTIAIETGWGFNSTDEIDLCFRHEVSEWLTAFAEGDVVSRIYRPHGTHKMFNDIMKVVRVNFCKDAEKVAAYVLDKKQNV